MTEWTPLPDPYSMIVAPEGTANGPAVYQFGDRDADCAECVLWGEAQDEWEAERRTLLERIESLRDARSMAEWTP